ncbi:MAG: c-type cytochrome [Myxococcales bacterium]|nr:c-type cytochrome [Myxococcales bacterium]
MLARSWQPLLLVALCATGAALAWAGDEADAPAPQADGEQLYDRFCLACHGIAGDGKGPALPLLWPQARNFLSGDYKWRTTSSGLPPTDEDLRRTIVFGVPGTSMHGFGDTLSNTQVDALIAKLKTFAPRKFRRSATKLALPENLSADVSRGKALFAELGCTKCHGNEAKGDGPSAPMLKDDAGRSASPYDLTEIPLRRPRARSGDATEQIYWSVVTGLSGTPMPAFEGAAPEADLWAVASYIESIRARESKEALDKSSQISPSAQAFDKEERLMKAGYYPGHGDAVERSLFGGAIAPQGTPPKGLTPAQASLDAKRCSRCHNKQAREWKSSLHAKAGSPGLVAQLIDMERRGSWASLQSCQRCHNPLAEQSPILSAEQRGAEKGYEGNPNYSENLRDQGLNCASCHVRNWQRLGPPSVPARGRLALPGYPVTKLALYERSDFCMPCHQLPSRNTLAGAPLLNTYKEWLEGPYMSRGVQCQHCHMPDREHSWKGVHDPETFREGVELSMIAGRSESGTVSVRVKVKNAGAGHYLPTTPTPAAWVSIQLVDAEGKAIGGAYAEKRIGRHLVYEGGWKQIEDTRIPPGESLELAAAWKSGRVSETRSARIRVRVEPDEYYERFYMSRLKRKLPAKERAMFEEALQGTRDSHYVAIDRLLSIEN